jgi:hypothetical protein
MHCKERGISITPHAGEAIHKGRVALESACFRRLFPRTPLAGFFGNGEIGIQHLPRPGGPGGWQHGNIAATVLLPPEPSPGPPGPLQLGRFLHSFTTVFLLVSTGNC